MSDFGKWRAVNVSAQVSAARLSNLVHEAAMNIGLDGQAAKSLGDEVARLSVGYGYRVVAK